MHTFETQRIVDADRVADYREVTASEKTALEKADAAAEPWPEWLITQWNESWRAYDRDIRPITKGRYNPDTGFGEGNGLLDITASQAVAILLAGKVSTGVANQNRYQMKEIRTHLPPYKGYRGGSIEAEMMFWDSDVEVVDLEILRPIYGTLANCKKLHTVNLYSLGYGTWSYLFDNDYALEHIYIRTLEERDVDLHWSPKISYDSLSRIVAAAPDTFKTGASIKLHANAFARLTDEIIANAAAKNITFVTA